MSTTLKAFLQKSAKKATIISSVITALVAVFFFYLYISLPSVPSQQAQASLNEVSNHDSCGKLQFTFTQNPGGGNVCAIGVATRTNSYTYTVKVTSMDGKSHSFVYDTYNYFCPEGYLGGANCLENGQLHTNVTGHTGDSITMTRTPTTGSFCGRYQMDFKVTAVDGSSSCHFWGGNNTNAGSSGSCQTGVTCGSNSCTPKTYNECEMGNPTFCHDKGGVPTGHIAQVTQNAACGYSCKDLGPCTVPTATPTPRPSATPTPTNTPVPSATPTPTGMPTATPTPTNMPTATPTMVPTATPTQPSQNTNNCDNSTQTGNNNANNNCNSNTNNNNNSNNQSQSQTQNNNQNVNVTVNNNNQQEVLAAATTVTPVPTSLPSTGADATVWMSLFGLIPAGFTIKKFAKLG